MSSFKQFLLVLIACLLSIGAVVAQSDTSTATETQLSNSTSISSTSTTTPTATASTVAEIPSTVSSSINSATVSSGTPPELPSVQGTGFHSNGNDQSGPEQSWLRQNNRFVFVIFLGLIVLSILIWYIYRSVKGMRKRLEQENQAQLYMIQQASTPHPPPPTQNRNDRVISEPTQPIPTAYKTEETQHQPSNSDTHRY